MNPLINGWLGMLGGVVSGAAMGLLFHNEAWLGGYGSHARRLVRLGHISFFGIGFLNFMLGLTAGPLGLSESATGWATKGLLLAAVGMPACCFLTAWRKPFRHLFPIPVAGAGLAILVVLQGARQ